MPTGKKIYWDTCVFLSWLRDETRPQEIKDGIDKVLTDVQEHNCTLYTSAITQIEILPSFFTSEEKAEEYRLLFDRPNVVTVAVDLRVGRIASEIRDFYHGQNPQVKFSIPDVIHIASAIVIGADEMQTLDGCGARRKPEDILSLSGKKIADKYDLELATPLFLTPLFAPDQLDGKATERPALPPRKQQTKITAKKK